MSKIHKESSKTKTACGITIREKAPFPYTHWIFNNSIETDNSGAFVDCKKCLNSINKENKK